MLPSTRTSPRFGRVLFATAVLLVLSLLPATGNAQSARAAGYRFPWANGTQMQYGSLGIHNADYDSIFGSSGWKAVDLLSDGNTGAGHAPNQLLAAADGNIAAICNDGLSVAIKVDNLIYAHILNNGNLTVGHHFGQGDYIGQLKTGTFSGNCGYANQNSNWFHVHLGFPAGSLQMESWTLNTSDGIWRNGSQTVGVNGWLTASGGSGGACAGPSLNSPSNGATLTSDTITFSWNALSGCSFNGYTLRVRADTNFDGDVSGHLYDGGQGSTSATVTIPSGHHNQTLYWAVKAANAANGASWSYRSFTIVPQVSPPSAPGNPSATAISSTQIQLSWSYASGAAGYRIKRWDGVSAWPVLVDNLNSGYNSYTDGNLTPGATYWYYICAFNSGGETCITNWVTATLPVSAPSAPGNVTGTGISSSQIQLSWSSASGANGYRVMRTDGHDSWPWPVIADNLGSGTTSYTDGGLSPNSTYLYYVCAFNSGGETCNSPYVSGTTQPAVTVPIAPTSSSATAITTSSIRFTWLDNSNNEDGFYVYRWSAPDGQQWVLVNTTGPNATTFTDTGLQPGTTYWYDACAYNSAGSSCGTSDVSATTLLTWSVTLGASATSAVAGSSVTLTATANQDVGPTLYYIVILASDNSVVTYCGSGTTCTATVSSSSPGSQTYHGVVGSSTGASVQATSGTVTVTWTAAATYHVSGTVKNGVGAGLPNIDVEACSAYCYYATTTADGTYSVTVDPNESYYLRFDDSSGTYASGYYTTSGFTPDPGFASNVAVATGDVSSVDIALPLAVHISGTATDMGSVGLGGVFVLACTNGAYTPDLPGTALPNATTGNGCYVATTAGNGTYSLAVAPHDSYILRFFSDSSETYLYGYYSTGGITLDYGSATPVVVATSDVTGRNVQVVPAAPWVLTLGSNATTVTPGTSVTLTAHASRDVGSTPYRLVILASDGSVVTWCGSGTTCSATVTSSTLGSRTYHAVVGMWDGSSTLVTSATVTVTWANPPGRPTGVTGTAGNASALVSWTAPASNGGSTITGYTVTSTPGGYTCTWSSGPLSCTVSGLTNGQGYTFTVHATNGVGDGSESDPSAAVTPVAPRSGATYHAITPTRVLDTRNGTGGLSGPFTNHVARTFMVAGVPAGATAVTGNLTVTGQTSSGYLFIGPVAMNNPVSSTLNFPVGDDRANAVTVALGGGSLSITFVAPSSGPTAHAIFDVTGYFTPDTSGATYHALTPTRVLDTRNGTGGLAGPFTNHAARTFTVGGVPAGATAVTGNLTVTGQTSSGYLSIGPVATNNPTSSTLNFPVGDDRANAVTVALGAGGSLSITFVAPSNGPSVHAIFDVTGYFTPNMSGATYFALTPTRVLDTRNGTGGLSGPFTNHSARTFTVGGAPSGAIAVTGNLTVTGQTSSGFFSIGPVAANNPGSSTLNFPVGDDRANAVTVALGAGGTLSIAFVAPSNGPTAHAIFDVTGYFTP